MAKRTEQSYTKVIVSRKSGQPQVNLSHGTVLSLMGQAGAEKPEKGKPLALGAPAKGKAHLVWACVTASGEEFNIVQGDTHGVWLSHQDGVGREKFEALLSALVVGQSAAFRVVAVKYVPAGAEAASDGGEAIEIE